MAFEPIDIVTAKEFAARIRFKAELDPTDQTVRFVMEPAIPKDMKPKIADVITSCADYYQRSLFLGEYEVRKEDGPLPKFANPLDEINYKLDFFLEEFRAEVSRATEAEKIKISPFAREMLKYRNFMNRQKIERLKREQEQKQPE